MGLFRKEAECENCKSIVSKKDIICYDKSHQREFKKNKKEKICKDCAMEKLYQSILNIKDTLVIIAPINLKKYNAYVTYHFERLEKVQSPQSVVEAYRNTKNQMELIIPKEKIQCSRCDKNALHVFCESNGMYDDPFDMKFNINVKHENLCPECAAKALIETFQKDQIIIRDIYPPINGRGFLCSWQV